MGAKLVLDILGGKTADELPMIMKSPNQYFGDYSVMKKFGIKENQFPQETIFINPQPQFYKEHKVAIGITVAVIICLSVLSILLLITIVKKENIHGNIEYANPAFESVTGYSLAEAKGHNPRLLKSGKQSKEFYDDLWKKLKNETAWRGRFINRRKKTFIRNNILAIHVSQHFRLYWAGFKTDKKVRYDAYSDLH